MTKILFADRVYMTEKAILLLKTLGTVEYFEGTREDELAEKAVDTDIIVAEVREISEKVIKVAKRLKGILVFGVGYNHVDIRAASNRGIYVVNTKGRNAEAVAEFVFFLILDQARRGCMTDKFVREHKWGETGSGENPNWMLGSELFGKDLGIIGFGEIGRRVARIAKGFRMNILAWGPNLDSREAKDGDANFVDLPTLIRESDFITLHAPLNTETKGLFGKEEISMMKRSAVLINTSRGAIIDEKALIEALKCGKIAGAGLDVFGEEPLPSNSQLFSFENTTLSPHIAGNTREANEACAEEIARSAQMILAGKVPKNVVNLDEILRLNDRAASKEKELN